MHMLLSWSGWVPLAYTLLHAIWQTALVAGLLAALLRFLPASRSSARYALSLTALAVALLMAATTLGVVSHRMAAPPATRIAQLQPHAEPVAPREPRGPGASIGSTAIPSEDVHPQRERVETQVPGSSAMIGVLWMLGAAAMLLRAAGSLMATRRLVREARDVDDITVRDLLSRLCGEAGLRSTVRLMQSERLRTAGALGIVRPIILMPASMLSGLTPDELRLVLAHELAHLQRRDFLINILQMLVESVLFYCPGVWWISRVIRREREACCDIIASRRGHSTQMYAAVLARCAAWVPGARPYRGTRSTPILQLHGPDSALVDRVRRLLDPGHHPRSLLPLGTLMGTFTAGIVILTVLVGTTSAAARAIADILTPTQRLDLLIETSQRAGLPSASTTDPARVRLLRGTWTLPDGHTGFSPWKPQRSVNVIGQLRTADMTSTIRGTATPDGRFEIPVQRGEIVVLITGDGFAPTTIGPLRIASNDQDPLEIEVELQRGFPAQIALRDHLERPLANLPVTLAATIEDLAVPYHLTSDDTGTVHVPFAAEGRYTLSLRAAGFEELDRHPLTLQPDHAAVVTLTPARPAVGRITGVDERPIGGARIRIAGVQIASTARGYGEQGDIIAHTDEQGRFTLASLRRGASVALIVEADEHAPVVLRNVRAGDDAIHAMLHRERAIRAHLSAGLLEKLPDSAGQPYLTLRQHLSLGDGYGYGLFRRVPVTVNEDGTGSIHARQLFSAETQVEATGHTIWSGTPADGLHEITLSEPSAAFAPKRITIRVTLPGDHPPAHGTLHITRSRGASPVASSQLLRVPLIDGAGIVDGQDGDTFAIMPGDLIGAWFAGPVVLTVPADSDRQDLKIEALPAGAAHVSIARANSEDESWSVDVLTTDPNTSERHQNFSASHTPLSSAFTAFISPLPLDRTFVVIASSGPRHLASDPFAITVHSPLPKVVLDAQPARDITLRILGIDDQPLTGQPINLTWTYEHHLVRSGAPLWSDLDGTVTVPRLPLASNGTYRLDLLAHEAFAEARVSLPLPLHSSASSGEPIVVTIRRTATSASIK